MFVSSSSCVWACACMHILNTVSCYFYTSQHLIEIGRKLGILLRVCPVCKFSEEMIRKKTTRNILVPRMFSVDKRLPCLSASSSKSCTTEKLCPIWNPIHGQSGCDLRNFESTKIDIIGEHLTVDICYDSDRACVKKG